ncbi:MAG TPA: hypothetical protein VHD38_00235 [Candidatus Paceibacterota bacterium]|nr:hypothetical protein [Candidatus Paceibacterota bacterium]
MNIHTGHTEPGPYKKIYNGIFGFFESLFGGPEALEEERKEAQMEHPGATLDGLDHVAAAEDTIGEM